MGSVKGHSPEPAGTGKMRRKRSHGTPGDATSRPPAATGAANSMVAIVKVYVGRCQPKWDMLVLVSVGGSFFGLILAGFFITLFFVLRTFYGGVTPPPGAIEASTDVLQKQIDPQTEKLILDNFIIKDTVLSDRLYSNS